MSKQKEKIELRDKIIQTARGLFAKFGYRKTTMDDIARNVKKGKSSIYYYFPGKEDIFKAVVLTEAKAFRQTILNAIDLCDDPRDKLEQYVITRMRTLSGYQNFIGILSEAQNSELQFVRRLKRIYDKEEIRLFRRILKEGMKANYFNILDLELAATAIVMAMKGMESTLFLSIDKPGFEQKLRDIIYTIFFGIVKR